jgi:hypothetical protein
VVMVREAGPRDGLLRRAIYLPALIGEVFVIGASLKLLATSLPLGLILAATGVVTTVLLLRLIVPGPVAATPAGSDGDPRFGPDGDVTGPAFDYIIWVALGLPMLMIVSLVVFVVIGALSR